MCAFILFGRADGIILPGRRCKCTAELTVILPVCRAGSVSVTTTVQKHAHSPTVSVGQKQNKKQNKKEMLGGGVEMAADFFVFDCVELLDILFSDLPHASFLQMKST